MTLAISQCAGLPSTFAGAPEACADLLRLVEAWGTMRLIASVGARHAAVSICASFGPDATEMNPFNMSAA